MRKQNDDIRAMLLGMGFDCKDGLIRVTRGKNFHLFGGSEGTHNTMFEQVTKFNEYLSKTGKTLETISKYEFYDIACKIGLRVNDPDRN